jgi:hypothetical protein
MPMLVAVTSDGFDQYSLGGIMVPFNNQKSSFINSPPSLSPSKIQNPKSKIINSSSPHRRPLTPRRWNRETSENPRTPSRSLAAFLGLSLHPESSRDT